MLEVALMFCFPIVGDLKGTLRISDHYVTIPQTYTHGSILAALVIAGETADSYICSDKVLEGKPIGSPKRAASKGWFWESGP